MAELVTLHQRQPPAVRYTEKYPLVNERPTVDSGLLYCCIATALQHGKGNWWPVGQERGL